MSADPLELKLICGYATYDKPKFDDKDMSAIKCLKKFDENDLNTERGFEIKCFKIPEGVLCIGFLLDECISFHVDFETNAYELQ